MRIALPPAVIVIARLQRSSRSRSRLPVGSRGGQGQGLRRTSCAEIRANASLAPVTTATSTAANVTGSTRHPTTSALPVRPALSHATRPGQQPKPGAPGPWKRTTGRTLPAAGQRIPRTSGCPGQLPRPGCGAPPLEAMTSTSNASSRPSRYRRPARLHHSHPVNHTSLIPAPARPGRGTVHDRQPLSNYLLAERCSRRRHPTRSHIRAASSHDPGPASASSCLKGRRTRINHEFPRFHVKPQVSAPGGTRTLATLLRSYPRLSAVATWQNARRGEAS